MPRLGSSDFEGSPNSVKECLASNTCVVSTPVGDLEFLISDVCGCHVSKTFSANELAQLCLRSLDTEFTNGRNKLLEKGLDMNIIARRIITEVYN